MLVTTVWVLCLTASTYASKLSPDFAAQLLVKSVEKNTNDNIIVSPYSLLGPLGALTLGSGYTTRREILDVLGLSNKSDVLELYDEYKKQLSKLHGVKLSTANKIYIDIDEEINHRTHSQAAKHFNIEVEYIDFNKTVDAAQAISHWVENKTHKNFELDLQPNPQLKAVLANAVSLSSPWGPSFQEENNTFYNKKRYLIPYIASSGYFGRTHSEELSATVVSVPLNDEACQFVVVAPDYPVPVESILKKLNDDGNVVNRAIQDLHTSFMMFSMPKLEEGTTTDLKKVLREMGVDRAFEDNAQIRRTLKNNSELFLDEATQNTYLLVDKEGVEGAAANIVGVMPQSAEVMKIPPPYFRVNRPYYIEIRCSNITLFNGIIRLPKPIFGQCCGGR